MTEASGRLVVIAGGGTAGHVLPALAVAEVLHARGHARESLVFIGSRRGMESRLVRDAGFAVVGLPGRGIARGASLANVAAAAGLAVATARVIGRFARHRPAVVLSVGGYAALPCAIGAAALRIPLVIAEANAVAGRANRLVARWSTAAAVAFEGTGLPRTVLTGNPVRAEVAALGGQLGRERGRTRDELGVPRDRVMVVVTGGSLGARRINEAALDLAVVWQHRSNLAIYHVIGARDWPILSTRLPTPAQLWYRAVRYEDRMPGVLGCADVVVGRAGATTLAELTVLGLPSILVPLPIAPDDHQAVSAGALVRAGAAVVVPDGELSTERLAAELGVLVDDAERRQAMARAAGALGRPDAAERVADLVEGCARGC